MARNLRATNNLDVSGSLKVTGSARFDGDVTLGDDISDNIFISGALKNDGGASLTGSFSGSGANLNQLTSSNINNFTDDVRNKISGVGVISYNPSTGEIGYAGAGGTIYTDGNVTGSGTAIDPIRTKENITGSSITASVGISASYYYGDGSNLTGLPNPDLSGYATLTGVSASFTIPTQVSGAITSSLTNYPVRTEVSGAITSSISNFPTRIEVTGVLSPYALSTNISNSFGLKTDLTASYARLGEVNTFSAAQNIFNNDVVINGTASIARLNTVNQQSLVIGDKYITLLSGASTHVDMDGAGILFGSGSSDPTTGDQSSVAHIVYRKGNAPSDYTSDYIEVYPQLRSAGVISGSNLTGSNTGDETSETIKSKLGSGSASTDGYISSADWTTFNNKLSSVSVGGNITGSGTSGSPLGTSLNPTFTTVTASTGFSGGSFNGTSISGSSTLQAGGQSTFGAGVKIAYSAKTGNYSLTASSDYVVSFSGSNLTGTLPSAANIQGSVLVCKNLHTSSLFISASAGTIDGSTTGVYINGRYTSYTFISDNTNWLII